VGHNHLVVTEGLAERMGGHLDIDIKLGCNTLEDTVNGFDAQGFVEVATVIGNTTEHIVAERDIRSVLQIEGDCFDDRSIDGHISVLLALTSVAGLLLEDGKAVLECEVVVNEVGEAEHTKVAHAKSKVDTYDEEHIVAVSTFIYKVLGDTLNIVHTLNRFGCVFRCQLTVSILYSRGDEPGGELTVVLAKKRHIDDGSLSGIIELENSHKYLSFLHFTTTQVVNY